LEATARGSASVASIMRRSLALSPHHPRRPRNRSCDSITDNSSCARFKPARALSELRLRSLSIRRSAAATRSRARSKSATVYCGGSRRVRFFLGPFVTLLARTAALSRVPVAIVPFRFEVPQQLIRTALELELQEGTVVADRVGETPCIFLAGLHRAERTIVYRLNRLANGSCLGPGSMQTRLFGSRSTSALPLPKVRWRQSALICKVLVMTGGPGVGKTTIVKAILRILAAKGTGLLLCAPTGEPDHHQRPSHQPGPNA